MKAIIKEVKFIKEFDSKFGKMYNYQISYNDKKAYYSCKDQNQQKFIVDKEAEFLEEIKEGKNGTYTFVKPMNAFVKSGYAKEIKKEQSKYSGFAVSYCKDLIIAGKLEMKDWEAASKKIFQFMVDLDKSIAHD
jgi:hypothetical protein